MKITFENDDKDLLMRGIAKFIDTGFVSRLEAVVVEIESVFKSDAEDDLDRGEQECANWVIKLIHSAFPELPPRGQNEDNCREENK